MSNNTLVIGGTGKTGKRVAENLKTLGIPVRIGSRQASIPFDWNNSLTWENALEGMQKVYITFQPDLAVPGSADAVRSLAETAKKTGVQKLVLLSGRGEKEAEVCENVIIESGIDWTIVRASWFMQNFSENFLLDSVLSGHVILPEVTALEPFVDANDIAEVVVETLTNATYSGKTLDLTGPELLSFEKAVASISKAINRPITFQEVSIEKYLSILKTYQLPEDFIWLIQYLFTEVLDGRNESLTSDIEKVLYRRATSFNDYILKTAATGVWNPIQLKK